MACKPIGVWTHSCRDVDGRIHLRVCDRFNVLDLELLIITHLSYIDWETGIVRTFCSIVILAMWFMLTSTVSLRRSVCLATDGATRNNMSPFQGKTLETPERVPFRLTQNLIDGLGVTGVEGVFRIACEVTMQLLRDNKDSLMSVLDAFIHDPLVEWEDEKRKLVRISRSVPA